MYRPSIARATWPILAAALALSTSVALGADAGGVPTAAVPAQVASARQAQVEALTAPAPAEDFAGTADGVPAALVGLAAREIAAASFWPTPTASPAPRSPSPATVARAQPTRTTKPTTATATSTSQVWWKVYQGVNHVWMPTLGVNRAVSFYSCSSSAYPANIVYRWGCGGTNNVYLFGHAYGVFKPLHDAYDAHTLKTGMPVIYADASGRERLYRVASWRVVKPTDSAWAIASQSVPSMTLQTCVGANDAYRLIVRLVVATR